ncbi:MAG: hypothetical protein QXG17_00790 [Sulfolobales archaeon]
MFLYILASYATALNSLLESFFDSTITCAVRNLVLRAESHKVGPGPSRYLPSRCIYIACQDVSTCGKSVLRLKKRVYDRKERPEDESISTWPNGYSSRASGLTYVNTATHREYWSYSVEHGLLKFLWGFC